MADQQESQDLPAIETTLVAHLLHWLLSLIKFQSDVRLVG